MNSLIANRATAVTVAESEDNMNETYKQGENIGYRQALLDLSVIILSKEYSTMEIVEIIDNLKSIKENEFNNI